MAPLRHKTFRLCASTWQTIVLCTRMVLIASFAKVPQGCHLLWRSLHHLMDDLVLVRTTQQQPAAPRLGGTEEALIEVCN